MLVMVGAAVCYALDIPEQHLSADTLVIANIFENAVEGTRFHRLVGGYCCRMTARRERSKLHVAATLMDEVVIPSTDEVIRKIYAVNISRELHATASTSSRMRWRRIAAGTSVSK